MPGAWMLRGWYASLRIELDSGMREYLRRDPRGHIFIIWHNQVFIAAELHRRLRGHQNQLVALVSGSRDGAWLAGIFEVIGVRAARGSQNRRGAAGAREILGVLRAGYDTGITPDGSRGPVYVAKEGAAMVARQSGAPLVLISARFCAALRLRSWDRFYLPWPFSRVICRMEAFDSLEALSPGGDRAAGAAAITAKLNELGAGTDPELGI